MLCDCPTARVSNRSQREEPKKKKRKPEPANRNQADSKSQSVFVKNLSFVGSALNEMPFMGEISIICTFRPRSDLVRATV